MKVFEAVKFGKTRFAIGPSCFEFWAFVGSHGEAVGDDVPIALEKAFVGEGAVGITSCCVFNGGRKGRCGCERSGSSGGSCEGVSALSEAKHCQDVTERDHDVCAMDLLSLDSLTHSLIKK